MKKSRILIVDDTPSIHEDFKKILMSWDHSGDDLSNMADSLFGKGNEKQVFQGISYELESAFQGDEALKMIEKAEKEGDGYSLVFMDVRMPPGQDGIKTIEKIWQKYPLMEVVICTAYSDYSWADIVEILGPSDHLLVLKKPFDADEAQQMALAMTKRSEKTRSNIDYIEALKEKLENCSFNVAKLKDELLAKSGG